MPKHPLRTLMHIGALLAALAFLGLSVKPGAATALFTTPADPIAHALERASAAGSYSFDGDVVQIVVPVPTVRNVGRTARTDTVHLEGSSNLTLRTLEMQIWSQAGNVLDPQSSVSMRAEDGKQYVRQGAGEWQESPGVTEGLAPQGDFMAYLRAVRDVQTHAPETRAGIVLTRHSFTLDGPVFAAYVRSQLEAALIAKGELPSGMHIETPDYYRLMTGTGELWVSESGLPLRQILNLDFPAQNDETIHAQIRIDFSRFGVAAAAAAGSGSGPTTFLDAAWMFVAPFLGWVPATVTLFGCTLLAAAILAFRRTRRLQQILSVSMIVAMVIGPVLSNIKIASFIDAQEAKAAAQEQQQAESSMQRSLSELDSVPEFNPQLNPLERAGDPAPEVQFAAGAFPFAADFSPVEGAPAVLLTDSGLDTDGDGLTDFQEERTGTDELQSDSDGDLISDNVEVRGFTLGGKIWFANPNALDSNDDSLGDGQEWDSNGDSLPDDTDNDQIPDLFDNDNDGDGVSDRKDLAPFAASSTVFRETTPLVLTLNDLTAGVPAFVDFQLRPTNANHLWFAFNVLDWPQGDGDGQVQDTDGATFADLATAAGRTSGSNESYGDLKLIPMLEIRMPDAGAAANLPSQSDLTPYNVTVNDFDDAGIAKVAYVPLSMVTDEKTGERVAFSARMPYLPTGTWATPHTVRLAWVVQALVDVPCDPNAADAADQGCGADGYIRNQPQTLQSYYDDWQLTGLNVSEDHGASTALVFEDPAIDPDLKDDFSLTALAYGLDNAYLGARDDNGDNVRDITIHDFGVRFDYTQNSATPTDERWGLDGSNNNLRVSARTYNTFDKAVMFTAMTETVSLLTTFDAAWQADNSLKPTLLYAFERSSRPVSLDALRSGGGYVTVNGNALTVDMAPSGQPAAELNVTAGIKWSHYCRAAGSAWALCSDEVFWSELDARYGDSDVVLAGDNVNDPDIANGRRMVNHLYDLALSQGINRTVELDNRLISGTYSLKGDSATASQIRSYAALGKVGVTAIANFSIMAYYVQGTGLLKYLGGIFGKLVNNLAKSALALALKDAAAIVKNFKTDRLAATGVVLAAVLVIAALGVGLYYLVTYLAGNSDAALVSIKIVVLSVMILFSVVLPIISAISLVSSAGSYTAALKSASELVGTSRYAGAVGAVIGIAITWGFFIYSMVSNKVTAFSPEFNRALAETIAATIYLILLAVLAATVVGLIIVAIIGAIDAILTAACELDTAINGDSSLRDAPGLGGACFTLGTVAIKGIAYFLYNYDLMVDTARNDMVSPGAPDTDLAEPTKGFIEGNALTITLPITTHAVHKDPDPESGLYINFYLWLFSADNLRSSTFRYSVTQPDPETITNVDRGQMSGAWTNVGVDHRYAATAMYGGYASVTPPPVGGILLEPGINQPARFYLNMSYALPAFECWVVPSPIVVPLVPVCYTRTFKGDNSSLVETLLYDIFPATLDGFMTMGGKPDGGRGLAWDAGFPSLHDADGDGLRANIHGGLDPNDTAWDIDGDRLADAYELEQRAAGAPFSPISCDTDGDGLTDLQETRYNTNPSIADTDNDGLSDNQEIWHQTFNASTCAFSGDWSGGWTITINSPTPFTVRVESDPLRPDADSDGISDKAEWQLAQNTDPAKRIDDQNRPYHPGVFNTPPIAIYPVFNDDDGFLAPGQTVDLATTVVARAAMSPSVLDITAPAALGGVQAPITLAFDPSSFNGEQTLTSVTALTVLAGTTTQTLPVTSSVRARLAPIGSDALKWDYATVSAGGATSIDLQAALGTYSSPSLPRFSSATMALADRQDTFLMSTLVSDTAKQGYIQTNAIPGGENRVTDSGNSNTTALRSSTQAPDIACNDNGVCLAVWDQYEFCNTLYIDDATVKIADSGDANAGIEPTIWFVSDVNDTNGRDGGWTYLSRLGTDVVAETTVAVNRSVSFCGQARIEIWDVDGDATDFFSGAETDDDSVGNLVIDHRGFLCADAADLRCDDTSTDTNFGDGVRIEILPGSFVDAGMRVWLDLRMDPFKVRHRHLVMAQRMDAAGNLVGAPFRVATPNAGNYEFGFAPVVASNGTDFLVATESGFHGGTGSNQTYIQLARYDSSGAQIANSANAYLHDVARTQSLATNALGMDLVWAGDHYRLAWKTLQPRDSSSSDDPLLKFAKIPATGVPQPANITSVTDGSNQAAYADASGAPSLAYDARNNRTLLIYRSANSCVNATLYEGGSTTPTRSDRFLLGGGSNYTSCALTSDRPLAAYSPVANSWLVSWVQNGNQGVNFFAPDLALASNQPWDFYPRTIMEVRPTLTLGSATSSFPPSRSLACPATSSQAVADLRFEEFPGATLFADSSGRGAYAYCMGDGCPAAGLAGATDGGGLAAGTPASDFAIGFDGVNDLLSFNSSLQPGFTMAFWYKSDAGATGNFTIGNGGTATDFSFIVGATALDLYSGGTRLTAATNLNDGQWHHVALVRDASSGRLAIHLGGSSNPTALALTSGTPGAPSLELSGRKAQIDNLQVWATDLSGSTINALYNRTLQSYCIAGGRDSSTLKWAKLNISRSDTRGGKLTASAATSIRVDAGAPASAAGGYSDGAYVMGNTIHTVGGFASDTPAGAGSGVARVEVSVNNGAWELAAGAETWAYNLAVAEGAYTIRSRAVDAVGNEETPGAGITFIADGTPPVLTIQAIGATPIVPERTAAGDWSVTLTGTAGDPAAGDRPGSGVDPTSVEVLLQGKDGVVLGNGWQPATLNGSNWNVAYLLPGALEPTGVYSVSVRATDLVGGINSAGANRTSDSAATAILQLDAAGPDAALSAEDVARQLITGALTIGGTVTDTNSTAGIDTLEIAFTPVEQIAALPSDVSGEEAAALLDAAGRQWLPVTLAQRGPGVATSTWSIALPVTLENVYQIDLRATDMVGNRRVSASAWRGLIDSTAPRTVATAQWTGAQFWNPVLGIQQYNVLYTCAASDRHLDETGFDCPGNTLQPPTRIFEENPALQALFPDLTVRSGLVNSYTLWANAPAPTITARSCDIFGQCITVETPGAPPPAGGAPAPGAPLAVVIDPTAGRFVAGTTQFNATVAAEAGAGLREVILTLDGVDVAVLAFTQAEAITRTMRTLSLALSGEGEHTIVARATDWAGATQSATYPVRIWFDTQAPLLALDATPIDSADTYQRQSGILRFRGTASDSLRLAAVQVRVGEEPFTDAFFEAGAWSTALVVEDPEGQVLPVTVRALDFAGRTTVVTQNLATNLSIVDAPDTVIDGGPASPSASTTADFNFTGLPGGREVSTFECRLDGSSFAPCSSPWRVGDLSQGQHLFEVRAIDAAGFPDLSPAAFAWETSAVQPETFITAAPADPTTSRAAEFSFSGAPGAALFQCALDESAFTSCSSPQHYSGLANGQHRFAVRALTGAGQAGTAIRFVWTVTNSVPVANSQAYTTLVDVAVPILLSAEDGDALSYRIIDGPDKGLLLGIAPDLTYVPDTRAAGPDNFTFVANDGETDSNVATVSILVNHAPVAQGQMLVTDEDTPLAITLEGSDADNNPLTFNLLITPVNGILSGTAPALVYLPKNNFNGVDSFTFQTNDGLVDSATANVTITVNAVNDAPWLSPITVEGGVTVAPIGSTIRVRESFTDVEISDIHTALWNWDDGTTGPGALVEANGAGVITGSHTYTLPGVYGVGLSVSDGMTVTATSFDYVIIYDPAAGFVVGNGSIDSPPGAYVPDPAMTGKATFGFVSKYQKGQSKPGGNTQFEFKTAGLDFRSSSYEWLVVAGSKAMFKGAGMINGTGSYGFLISAGDGAPDRFRIKIWDKSRGDVVVYDNQIGAADDAAPTTAISSGQITIQTGKSGKSATGAEEVNEEVPAEEIPVEEIAEEIAEEVAEEDTGDESDAGDGATDGDAGEETGAGVGNTLFLPLITQ